MLVPHIEALASHVPSEADTGTTGYLLSLAGLFLLGQGYAKVSAEALQGHQAERDPARRR